MNRKTMLSLLLVSAVCVAPAYANFFSNPKTNTMLNIGSAPSPTPAQLAAIGDADYAIPPRNYRERGVPPPSARYSEAPADGVYDGDEDVSDNGVFEEEADAADMAALTAMEGKTVFGARGERLGYVLAVDQGARLIELQIPSGIAVSMPASLVVDKGARLSTSTVSRADAMAMAKAQTGRTVAVIIDLSKRPG